MTVLHIVVVVVVAWVMSVVARVIAEDLWDRSMH